MHLLLIATLFIWGGGMMASLLMATRLVHEEADHGRASLLSHVIVRGGACLATGLALVSLSVITSITSHIVEVWRFLLPAWAACSAPLLLPTGKAPLFGVRISPVTLVGASFGLTIAFALSLALYVLVTLFRTQPILG